MFRNKVRPTHLSWAQSLTPSREWGFVALVLIIGMICLILWADFRGALGASRNDDWVYLHMTKWFTESGNFIVDSESMTNASGLVFLATPVVMIFGYSIQVLQIFVSIIGIVGLFATWLIIRTFLPIFWAAVALLCLILTPYWASISLSFMTDVPAYTFQCLALLSLLYAIRTGTIKVPLLALGLVFSLIAFANREYGIVSGVTLLVVSIVLIFAQNYPNRKKLNVLLCGLLFMVSAYSLFKWRSSLPNSQVSGFSISQAETIASIYLLLSGLVTLSIFLIPAVVIFSVSKLIKANNLTKVSLFVLTLLLALYSGYRLSTKGPLTLRNYFTVNGSYAETLPLGSYPQVISQDLFTLIQWVGVLSFALISAIFMLQFASSLHRIKFEKLLNRLTSNAPITIIAFFVVANIALLSLVVTLTTAPLFDRYLLPLFAFSAALIIKSIQVMKLESKFSKILSIFALSGLGIVSIIYTDSALVADGAQWRFGEKLVSEGYVPSEIDAGYMWFGYHQNQVATNANVKAVKNWWTTLYPSPAVCVQVGIGNSSSEEIGNLNILSTMEATNIFGTKYSLWAIEGPGECSTE